MSHFFADDGAKIHVQSAGDGPAIVMLHGWTSSHQEWLPFVPELSRDHRLLRWDARGHGGHDYAGAAPSAERMARDLANLFDHYRLDEVTVVGHSMGALTLWQYIRDFGTGRLARICCIDQSPRLLTDDDWPHGIYGEFGPAQATRMMGWLHEDFADAVLKLTAYGLNRRAREKYETGGWERSRAALARLNPGPLIACWESLTAADYRDVLEKIDVPAMLVYGGESNFYRAETARYVASRIPDAVLHIYEGSDHSPHQWQRERFARELIEFIGQADA